jgi:hypothetical protein
MGSSHSRSVFDEDLILVWTPVEKRIITGADILRRLLRGIASVAQAREAPRSVTPKDTPSEDRAWQRSPLAPQLSVRSTRR